MDGDLPAGVPAPKNPLDRGASYRVCLVCLGNICRSPMAEVVLRDEVARAGLGDRVAVESAGTGDWHLGEPMDPRAATELARRGYDGSAHIARQIKPHWLDRFDLLIVMDRMNLATLRHWADGDGEAAGRIRMMRSFDPAAGAGDEVPDPYHGGAAEYEETFELVHAAARGVAGQLAGLLGGEPGRAHG